VFLHDFSESVGNFACKSGKINKPNARRMLWSRSDKQDGSGKPIG